MAEAGESPQRFQLDIPATAEYLATARLFVGTLARTLGLDEDLVADVKLAASEAVTAVVVAGQAASATVVVEAGTSGGVSVAVGPATGALAQDGMGLDPVTVVDALFPGAKVADGALRFEVGPR